MSNKLVCPEIVGVDCSFKSEGLDLTGSQRWEGDKLKILLSFVNSITFKAVGIWTNRKWPHIVPYSAKECGKGAEYYLM